MTVNAIDLDAITEALSRKADIDLVNCTQDQMTTVSKEYFGGLGKPSGKYVNIATAVPIDSTQHPYTAPANGYLFVTKRCTGSQYVGAYDDSLFTHYEVWANDGQMANLFLPMKKGQTVIVRGSAAGADFIARFIYAEE